MSADLLMRSVKISTMLCLNDGLFLKPQLSSFRSVVFQHTVILLLLTDCCGGGVVGPSQTVVTLVGEDVVLPCYLEPALDAVSKSVEWGRRDLEPRFVHVWPEGLNFLRNQNPSYKGRTSVSTEKLKHGDLSLTLSAVKISDNGAYRCYFPAHSKESTVELVVGSVSSPIIAGTQSNGRVVVLQCESGGWYPEPEVLWLDGEGNLLPAGPTETGRRPDDLYTVSSRVTVEKRHSNSFTCRVQQRRTNQIREMNIQISDYCFAATSCSAVCTSIIVAVVLVFILPAGYFVWKWRQNKIKENNIHHEDEAEPGERKITSSLLDKEERDREEHTAEKEKTVFLDEKIYNLNKDLQMNKEEYKYVLQAINTVKACRKELDKHRDFFQQLSEFIKKDIGLMEHRLDQAFRVDKKNKFQGNMEDLMEKQRVTEKLLQDTQKLLQETDDDVTQLTERKGQLELLKDQINKHLVEIKNQRDEIQVKLQTEQSERDEG